MEEADLNINAESQLAEDQALALAALNRSSKTSTGGRANIFLTGSAGSGKSHIIKEWRMKSASDEIPVLASTGAAAVLVGGRTFHSFFGLGILEGGIEATFERAIKDRRLAKRLKEVHTLLIDEISMISGQAFEAADRISRRILGQNQAFGGLRIVAVGDFSQLPPVARGGEARDWCFSTDSWRDCEFQVIELRINHRVKDSEFLQVLEKVRQGQISTEVKDFLNQRLDASQRLFKEADRDLSEAPRLFPRRDQVDQFNQESLAALPGTLKKYQSIFMTGAAPEAQRKSASSLEALRRNIPIKEELELKIACRVLFVQNDPQKRWVNGTRGKVKEMKDDTIIVEKEGGRTVKVERVNFSLLDADGEVIAGILGFPLVLAYAVTIHKSQGMTLSSIFTDLRRLWEPGQAYVALSRLRSAEGLFLAGWEQRSILVDPEVLRFYNRQA